MGVWVAVIVIAVVVLAAAFLVVRRRGGPAPAPEPEPAPRPARPEPAPMTDLESALNQVTDKAGRPIRERIDAEAAHVDDLRRPDDTSPLLRHALDSVEQHDDPESAGDPAEPA